jgi:hypothetical protein
MSVYLELGASVNRDCAMGADRRGELATIDFDAVILNPVSDVELFEGQKSRETHVAPVHLPFDFLPLTMSQ